MQSDVLTLLPLMFLTSPVAELVVMMAHDGMMPERLPLASHVCTDESDVALSTFPGTILKDVSAFQSEAVLLCCRCRTPCDSLWLWPSPLHWTEHCQRSYHLYGTRTKL